jgi:hypothetical protein
MAHHGGVGAFGPVVPGVDAAFGSDIVGVGNGATLFRVAAGAVGPARGAVAGAICPQNLSSKVC